MNSTFDEEIDFEIFFFALYSTRQDQTFKKRNHKSLEKCQSYSPNESKFTIFLQNCDSFDIHYPNANGKPVSYLKTQFLPPASSETKRFSALELARAVLDPIATVSRSLACTVLQPAGWILALQFHECRDSTRIQTLLNIEKR